MRKTIACMAIAALLAGIYWTIGHGQVHPDSPVGKCLTWLHGKPATGFQPITQVVEPFACKYEEPPLFVQAGKPVAVIHVQPDFQPMTDPDGNELPVISFGQSEPVRVVAVPSEEVRLMPGVEDEPVPAPEQPRKQISLGLKLTCPLQVVCELKCENCCKMLTFSGMYAYITQKTCGKETCPLAACMKAICPCAAARKPEVISEPPVAAEESEPPVKPEVKPMSWLDTMEARPSDLTPRARTYPY